MDYKNKYLKYKNKYLNLLAGGGNLNLLNGENKISFNIDYKPTIKLDVGSIVVINYKLYDGYQDFDAVYFITFIDRSNILHLKIINDDRNYIYKEIYIDTVNKTLFTHANEQKAKFIVIKIKNYIPSITYN